MTPVDATVRALLDAAGITCSDGEFLDFVSQYTSIKQKVEAMYAPAFADADPLLVLASDR